MPRRRHNVPSSASNIRTRRDSSQISDEIFEPDEEFSWRGFFVLPDKPILLKRKVKNDSPGFFDVPSEDRYIGLFIFRTLLFSRLWLFWLAHLGSQASFHTDAFLGDFELPSQQLRLNQPGISLFGLARWDALQFMFIARYGYILEHTLAFLPGFPYLLIVATNYVNHGANLFGFRANYVVFQIIGGFFINLVMFMLSGYMLYYISFMATRSVKTSLIAVVLFAYNPASIFFMALYSESLFCAMSFIAIYVFMYKWLGDYIAYVIRAFVTDSILCFAVCTRANGILNLGYSAWFIMQRVVWSTQLVRITDRNEIDNLEDERRRGDTFWMSLDDTKDIAEIKKVTIERDSFSFASKGLNFIWAYTWSHMIVFGVFASMCLERAKLYCKMSNPNLSPEIEAVAARNDYITVNQTNLSPWCRGILALPTHRALTVMPEDYAYVQKKYWNVGMFNYWTWRKLPCFLMAAPVFFLVIGCAFEYLNSLRKRKGFTNMWVILARKDHLVPHAVHAVVVVLSIAIFANVEIMTRMVFSSTPFLCIYLAQKFSELTTEGDKQGRFTYFGNHTCLYPPYIWSIFKNPNISLRSHFMYIFVVVYFLSYFFFGSIAHAAFLPFT